MPTPMKILLLEGVHPSAKARLEGAGFKVQSESSAWSEEQLTGALADCVALGIRSKTQLTEKILRAGPQMLAVGAFCIGTNQVDLVAANRMGIPVFNAPYSNTRSVAELVIAEMIALSRYLGDVNTSVHKGEWIKSAKGAHEVRGKVLGIVGYGHIGSQVSILAESLGFRVVYYDILKKLPLGNAKAMDSLEALLREADYVTLHVPETAQTMGMMQMAQLQMMRQGSYLINASRGTVVNIEALAEVIKAKHLSGAAIDVFPEEPQSNSDPFRSPLQGLKNVILTPHIGGSTEEAQEAIGHEVAESLLRLLNQGSTLGAVNFPAVDCPALNGDRRLVNVHRNVPGVLGEINGIVSKIGANIRAQYLSTDPQIGYMVMDFERGDSEAIYQKIRALPTSISTRLIG